MDNTMKSKTRLAAVQIVSQHLINKQDIENDMNSSLKQMKMNHNKKNGSRKKRQELSLSATRGLSMNHVTIEITFD